MPRIRQDPAADDIQREVWKNFPSMHPLADPRTCANFLDWNTFFRRNYHRFASDYLKIDLYDYQALALYELGANYRTVIVASRATAKTFLIALYACIRCILYPYTKILLSSATKGQSELIITDKIQGEFMTWFPMLAREIRSIKSNNQKSVVEFQNNSKITVVVANDNARGNRSNVIVREEFRQIDKYVEDSVLSPMQILRHAPYMNNPYYKKMPGLKEEAVDVYISSSWFDNGHWMWEIVDEAIADMYNGKPSCFLAFDEAVVLSHEIKSMQQLVKEKRKQDSLTWRIEFLNERVRENKSAYFTYSLLHQNQRSKRPFYPRTVADYVAGKRNPYEIPRQSGEVRIVSCDMAFVENKKNDNSVFSCLRLLPETTTYMRDDEQVTRENGYRRIVSYMEPIQGGDLFKQSVRIRQLFEDFDADYVVLDTRNGGITVLDILSRVLYDEERGIEYAPIICMNNEGYAHRVDTIDANRCIYAINASTSLNSKIAQDFKRILEAGQIDLLVSLEQAEEDILPKIKEYVNATDAYQQIFYEFPFLETQNLISETTALTYEKKLQTSAIVISESGSNRKDRYTSVSYGSYFATLLEQDLLSKSADYEYTVLVN